MEMERNALIRPRADAAAGLRPVLLRRCPHCGGDVRLVRDIYGSYRQCLQCSREIAPEALTANAGAADHRSGRRAVAERAVA